MKILFISFFLTTNLYAATCSNTTRSPYTATQILTSSALNADFNQLVTKSNDMDGGCITDASLESSAFNSSLDALKNGIQQGCLLSYSDANTVSVSKCMMSIGGIFVKTAAATTVTWLCSGCTVESASKLFYVYAKPSSTATALALLISDTAPQEHGLDVSGNKVIGRFYNNSASAIDSALVYSWVVSNFTQSPTGSNLESFSFAYGDTSSTVCSVHSTTCGYLVQTGSQVADFAKCDGVNCTAGIYTMTLLRNWTKLFCTVNASTATQPAINSPIASSLTNMLVFSTGVPFADTGTGVISFVPANTYGVVHCEGY